MKRRKSGFTPLEIRVSNLGSNRRSKRFLTGFTIVELLTVLAIITLLVGLLIPSLNMVRNMAKETKQKAQLASISQALLAFRSDYGNYPPSDNINGDYCGAQKLSEALLGRDLLGFHPQSTWSAIDPTYYIPATLDVRVGPYLELTTANEFRLGQLFSGNTGVLADTFVICDSFGLKRITLTGGGKTATVKAGTPILYYRADPSKPTLDAPRPDAWTYYYDDNQALLNLNRMTDGRLHPLGNPSDPLLGLYGFFKHYITDPRASTDLIIRSYRPDSYILISAGVDGLYGTGDDIANFGN